MAFDAFLKIDGISSDKLQGIELESFSWGVSNSGSIKGETGTGSGRAAFQDFSFTSLAGSHSPELLQKSITGERLEGGMLTITGATSRIFIKFSDVLISSYAMDEQATAKFLKVEDQGGTPGTFPLAGPADSVSFTFQKIELEVNGYAGGGGTSKGT